MKKRVLFLLFLLFTAIGSLSIILHKSDNLWSVKYRHIIAFIHEFPLSPKPTVPSLNSEEAKKRGSFIHDYQIVPINTNDSLVEPDIKEAFLEYGQYYILFRDTLINIENDYQLVFVFTERGKETANEWNKKHYYFKMTDRKALFYNDTWQPRDSILADTLVMDIKGVFNRIHRPHPKDVTEIWLKHSYTGSFTLIKKTEGKRDSVGTKWNAEIYPYTPGSFHYDSTIFEKDTNGVLGRPVPQETISSQYFVTEKLGKKHRRHRLVHRYKTPYDINYKLDITKMDFAEVFLEKGENYNLVFVYSKEGKRMAREWNQKHGYHKLSWEKNGRYTLPLSSDTPLDTLLADTLVVDLKHLFKENPRYPQPDHVRKIWDELYDFGTITLIKEK